MKMTEREFIAKLHEADGMEALELVGKLQQDEIHFTTQLFEDREALIAFLDSLHECDENGETVTGEKWYVAQEAANALRYPNGGDLTIQDIIKAYDQYDDEGEDASFTTNHPVFKMAASIDQFVKERSAILAAVVQGMSTTQLNRVFNAACEMKAGPLEHVLSDPALLHLFRVAGGSTPIDRSQPLTISRALGLRLLRALVLAGNVTRADMMEGQANER